VRTKFTKRSLDNMPPPDAGRLTFLDAEVDGLQLRVTSTGTKTFSVYRRVKGGNAERITLGRYPGLPLEAARRKAREVVADLAQGTSVAAENRRKKALSVTLAQVFEDYQMARKGLKESTVKDMRAALNDTVIYIFSSFRSRSGGAGTLPVRREIPLQCAPVCKSAK
jgi:hypothetical protein